MKTLLTLAVLFMALAHYFSWQEWRAMKKGDMEKMLKNWKLDAVFGFLAVLFGISALLTHLGIL